MNAVCQAGDYVVGIKGSASNYTYSISLDGQPLTEEQAQLDLGGSAVVSADNDARIFVYVLFGDQLKAQLGVYVQGDLIEGQYYALADLVFTDGNTVIYESDADNMTQCQVSLK